MFPNSGIAERFAPSRQKPFDVIRDGLSPLLAKEKQYLNIYVDLWWNHNQKKTKKQMDVLLRYCFKTTDFVETRYLLSFFAARAPADFVV